MESIDKNVKNIYNLREQELPDESAEGLENFLNKMKEDVEVAKIEYSEDSNTEEPVLPHRVKLVHEEDDEKEPIVDDTSVDIEDVIRAEISKKNNRKNIDLDKISVKVPKTKKDYLLLRKKRLDSQATYQVALPKSGYYAELTKLSSIEIQNLALNSQSNSRYVYRQKLLRLVYDKIKNTSIGKPSFTDFLHITAESELNILLYAIYCITYRDNNEYSVTCENCDKQYTFSAHNKDLLILEASRDANTILDIQDIILEVKTPEELMDKSFVSNVSRVQLENGCIYEIKEPSLYDGLERLYKNIDEEKYKDDITLGFVRFIDSILIPDSEDDTYIKINDFEDVYYEIKSLGDSDYFIVSEVIKEIADSDRVRFGLKNLVCPHCSYRSEDSIIDEMELLVFLQHQYQMEKFRGEGTGSN